MDSNDIRKAERFALLLSKKVAGKADQQELEEIDSWLAENNCREQYLGQLHDPAFLRQEMRARAAIDTDKAEEKTRARIERYERKQRKAAWRSRIVAITRIAAVFLLIAGGATLWWLKYTEVTPPTLSSEERQAMTLSMAEEDNRPMVEEATEKVKVITKQEIAKYNVDEDFAEALENGRKITTYSDKDYWLTLDDGTVVHLGSSSRIIYPDRFGRGQRDVILTGEAYFMVAEDKSRPFIVHTPNGDITEYGTKFHVNTNLITNQGTEVVLVSGSISVTGSDGEEKMLKPGQRALLGNEEVSIEAVDTAPYVAWHTGTFTFQDEKLSSVLNVLAHWFGCDVEYFNDQMGEMKISGTFDRYEDRDTILESLEEVTGLTIVHNDGLITIKP